MMPTGQELQRNFTRNFRQLYPKLREAEIILPSSAKSLHMPVSVDLIMRLKLGKKTPDLYCEFIVQRYPKQLREKGLSLLEVTQGGKEAYPVIIAPYISSLGRDTCKKIGIGFLDLSGNAYLDFDSFYMEIEGRPNRYKYPSESAGLFKPKSERILRFYLLADSQTDLINYRSIAKQVGVSLGQLSKVNKKLNELGLWKETSIDLKRIDKAKLLDLWRENYRFEKNRIQTFYSVMQVPQLEKRIAEICRENKFEYAFTLFSGANRLAPFTRYNFASTFFSGDLETFIRTVGLKEVTSGFNLQVIAPYDEGVYYKKLAIASSEIANPIQLYLDLYNYVGRGREQAEFLREKMIKF